MNQIITNKQELEWEELTLNRLRLLEEILYDEIKQEGKCLNADFHRVSKIQGAIAHSRRWCSHFKFQVLIGRGEQCPEYYMDQMAKSKELKAQ